MDTYNVIIVDDEKMIRNGIYNAIDWKSQGLKVVALLDNGDDAIQFSLENQVDICILDICMPIKSGLDYIDEMNTHQKECLYIVVTGYDNFDFARQGIKLKVFDYILKPVDEEELLSTIQYAKQTLDKKNANSTYLVQANRQIKKNLSFIKERFVLNWINGDFKENEIIEHLEFYHNQLDSKNLSIILLKTYIAGNSPHNTEWESQLERFAICNIFNELLQTIGYGIVCVDEFENYCGIANIVCDIDLDIFKENLQSAIAELLGKNCTIFISKSFDGYNNVSSEYLAHRMNFNQRDYCSTSITKAKKIIELSFNDPQLTLSKVAVEVFLSPSHLSKLFKKEMGVSFVDFLTMVRIRQSIQLLDNPDLLIYEIAEYTGFNSQHYYCSVFKKILGISPSDYRQSPALHRGKINEIIKK